MKNLIAFLCISACLTAAHSELIYSDSFAYPDGQVTTNTTLWVNNTGTTPMLVSNQQLVVTFNRSEDIAHQFASKLMTNGPASEVYASFKVVWTALPSQSGSYFTHFTGDSITFFRARVSVATTNYLAGSVAPPGYFHLGIGNNSPSTAVPFPPANGQLQTPLTTNVLYTVVFKYNLRDYTSTVWVDPVDVNSPSATADDYVDPANAVNITYIGFRQTGGIGSMVVDDLKVGTSFNDVAGANSAPAISPIQAQLAPANSTIGPIVFVVSDSETPAKDLIVSATSSNEAVIPNDQAHILIAGTEENRSITVTPRADAQGTSLITISVSDGVNNSTANFLVTVGGPTVSAIPSKIAAVNTSIPEIPVTLSDPEGDALTLRATSSNTNLLSSQDVVFFGSGNSRTIGLTPRPSALGVTTVNVFITDGFTTNSTRFTLTVKPTLGVLFDERFAYDQFTLPNSLYMASGSPWQTIPPGIAFQLQCTNGLAYLSYTNTEDLGAALNSAPFYGSNGVVLYTAFTVNFSELPSTNGNYFLLLKQTDADNQNFRARVFARAANAQAGMFRLGIANFSASEAAQFPMDLALNTAYQVVTRHNCGTGETVLWINPAREESGHVIALDNPGSSTIGAIGLRQDNGIGALAVGPIKVGTSFDDVFIAPPQPETQPLNFKFQDGRLVLTWMNSSFSLASSASIAGPFVKIQGATSPYTNSPTSGNKFFRLIWP